MTSGSRSASTSTRTTRTNPFEDESIATSREEKRDYLNTKGSEKPAAEVGNDCPSSTTSIFEGYSLKAEQPQENDLSTIPHKEDKTVACLTHKSAAASTSSVRERGALISGMSVGSRRGRIGQRLVDLDLETGSDVPESDLASHAPRSVWQSTLPTERTQYHERRIISSYGKAPKKRKKSLLWVSLGVISCLLIGAVIAVSVIVTKNKRHSSETEGNGSPSQGNSALSQRQQMISDAVSTVSNSDNLADANSPQSKALHWLILDDKLWANPEDGPTAERVIQRYTLAVFYFSTGASQLLKDGGWLGGDECKSGSWIGIECNEKGQILTLALDDQGLTGTIPEETGHLTTLENFVLKNNDGLAGTIPATIGKIKNLQQLGVYYSKLSSSIPTEIFSLASLKYLNFQNNKLSGKLSSDFGKLVNLETLVLMNNNLEGDVPFEKLTSAKLRFLGLSSNSFSGPILPITGYLTDLQFLYLDQNLFDGEIPASIGNASNLRSINLDNNKITGTIPSSLGRLVNLEYLSLQHNSVQGSLPKEIRVMSSLRTINLDSNELSGPLPDLSTLKNLRHLLISRNEFNGEIPQSILQLENLETLFLSSNNFTGSVPDFQRSASGSLKFKGVYLSDNNLTGTIPETICGLENLEALFMDENHLSGSIPSCISELSKLRQLYLFNNELSGEIPSLLGSMRQLSGIGLERNGLVGTVPAEICNRSDDELSLDFWSDCGSDSQGVTCDCCTVCCPSDECV